MPALLALLAALGQLPAPQLAQPGKAVNLTADCAEMDTATRALLAEGHVLVESGGLVLLTEELAYDVEGHRGNAGGGLLAVDGNLVLRAREGIFGTSGDESLSLESAELWQKTNIAPAVLKALRDPAAAGRTGRNALLLKAEHLERIAHGRYLARQLRMTPCDCGAETTPDWSLGAKEGDVEPGERAILWWPSIYVKSVPVLVLPALYVPLSTRRTGFLFPKAKLTNGFAIEEPFFWVLGESADLTLGLGYHFGGSNGANGRAAPNGVKGSAEFRYELAERSGGRLLLAGIEDRHSDAPPRARGMRGELVFRHSTDLPDGFSARADVKVVSDKNYLGDEAVDIINDAQAYLRSQAWAGWRGGPAAISLATTWYQDMLAQTGAEGWLFGKSAPVSFHRPLELSVNVPWLRLFASPLRAGLDVTAARYQPIPPFGGSVPDVDLSLTRLDVAPSVSWIMLSGGPLNAELYARARGDLASYDGERFGNTTARVRGIAGAWMGSELSRMYLGDGLKHTIEPRLELRAATQQFGAAPSLQGKVVPLDELNDPDGGFVQGVAAVSSRLVRKGRGNLARLELGQDLDLVQGQAGDTYGRIDVTPDFVNLSAVGRWAWGRGTSGLAQLAGSARLFDHRGDALSLSYDRMFQNGTGRVRAPLDALFGPRSNAGSVANQVGLAVTGTVVRGVSLRYETRLSTLNNTVTDLLGHIDHTAGVTLGSPCDCWRVDLFGTYSSSIGYRFGGVSLELKYLGSMSH